MYEEAVNYYDLLYQHKNYEEEVEYLKEIISQNGFDYKMELLDVACGTGMHITHFSKYYKVEGLDLSKIALKIARRKNKKTKFHYGDMQNFTVKKKYDIITCLFSSIGYILKKQDLIKTVANMKKHLKDHGIILIEPWFRPDNWKTGTIHLNVHDSEKIKIARMGTSLRKGNISYFDLHHLIGTSNGTEYIVEHHKMALYTQKEMEEAFIKNNLVVKYDPKGPFGRGLYIGLQ